MTLELVPVTLTYARNFVDEFHRHHIAPQGGLFAIGIGDGKEIIGVAIIGRPVARLLNDGFTAEVTRLCIKEGYLHAASKLYAACWRAARSVGYRRLVTYTLLEEQGISLIAAGYKVVGQTRGGSWDTPKYPRVDAHPTGPKRRWERAVNSLRSK